MEKKRQLCQIMTRCCGWLVAKHQSNPGKIAEYEDRKTYKTDEK